MNDFSRFCCSVCLSSQHLSLSPPGGSVSVGRLRGNVQIHVTETRKIPNLPVVQVLAGPPAGEKTFQFYLLNVVL